MENNLYLIEMSIKKPLEKKKRVVIIGSSPLPVENTSKKNQYMGLINISIKRISKNG